MSDQIPDWLIQLTRLVTDAIEVFPLVQWSARFDEEWELHMFPALIEVEGEELSPIATVDALTIYELFDDVTGLIVDIDGVTFSGTFATHEVELRFDFAPPEDEEPVARKNPDGSFEDLVPTTPYEPPSN